MTPLQRIQLKQSELRKDLSVLLDKENREDAETATMNEKTLELRSLENDYQTAVMLSNEKEPEETLKETSQGKEIRSIIQQTSIADYMNEAARGIPVTGAALELRHAAFGKDEQGYIPIDMFLDTDEEGLEKRADAITNYTASHDAVPSNQMQIYDRVFARSSAAYLGIDMPSVDIGTAIFPRISAGTAADVRSPSEELDGTAATVLAEAINPVRLTASYTFTLESLSLVQGVEAALRRDLMATMMDKRDKLAIQGQAVSGTTSPKIDGLLNTLTDPTDPGTIASVLDYVTAGDGAVDGKYAVDDSEVAILTNPATWQHAMGLQIATSGFFLREYLNRERFRASGNMPDAVNTIAKAIRYASGASSMARGVVMPTWRGMQVINDRYTRAKTGEFLLTFIQMVGWKVVDTSMYSQLEFKIA